ncbi:MAG: CDP-diacylglycerol--glycerol-3-phosphate 3-phosphatidyltransferase [Magnetovibrionaceae bacterium]
MQAHLPNILTTSRILIIPLVVVLMALGTPFGAWGAFALYTYACITDFFDGYLARALKVQSALGRFLDPIADKLLVATVLMVLVANDSLVGWHVVPAVVILIREILVSGLREFLAEVSVRVPVTYLAKWKTTIQMLALGFLIVGKVGPDFGPVSTSEIGLVGIWLAALLTLVTGYDYLRAGLKTVAEQDAAR